MTFERPGPKARIDWLDYARLLSALAVLAYHYLWGAHAVGLLAWEYPGVDAFAHFGYLGVDFFFLISGYVIMLSAEGREASKFAAARLVRLAPAFVFCMTLTWAVRGLWGGPQLAVSAGQWVANLTLQPSYFGYPYVDPSYWTLVAEVIFYALVFLVLLAGQARWLEQSVFAWLALQIADRLAGTHFFLLSGVFPLFVVGCMLHFGQYRGWSVPRVIGLVLSLGLSIVLETERTASILAHAPVAPVWSVGAALTGFVALFLLFGRWGPRLPYAKRLGALTYPLYLLHQVIGLILIAALAPLVGKWAAAVLTFAAMLAGAWFVSEYVEARLGPVWKRLAGGLTAPIAVLEHRLPLPPIGRRSPT
jgi:peptidoglycan/LPS O-acetylase OafA/YrhL